METYGDYALANQLEVSKRGDMATWLANRDKNLNPPITKIAANIVALTDQESAAAAASAATADYAYRSSRTASVALLVVGVLVAVAIGVIVARAIVQSLGRVRRGCPPICVAWSPASVIDQSAKPAFLVLVRLAALPVEHPRILGV